MTNVIAFKPDRNGRRTTLPDRPSQPASILLFTGVRYCREEAAAEASSASALPAARTMASTAAAERLQA